jgi:predicted metal-dependent enzyme (double-stranded beta helix superfamily)
MFDKERFVEECRTALKASDAHAAIRELVARAVSEPAHIVRALGEPRRAGVETIYKAEDLTILNLCWGPRMVFKPHDHRMCGPSSASTAGANRTFFTGAPTRA